jgi:ABC-type branched-subunit amino acid transport system ATPase component
MIDSSDILDIRSVGRSFGGLSVLRDVSFGVPEGGIVGLIGPNGSGKTTLFNLVTGYLEPDAGTILYRGRALTNETIQDRSRAGMVRTFQTPKVFEQMTVLENVMVGCCKLTRTTMIQDLLRSPHARTESARIARLAEDACARFELTPHRSTLAKNLPAGQRRILEIARAMAGEPKLLLLDEPSSGLNTDEIGYLSKSIEQINRDGISILLVSHDMDLMEVADQVHVLNFGEIIASGDMRSIQQNPQVRDVYLGV